MRLILTALLAAGSLCAAPDTMPATYVIGNIDGLSAGDDGMLRLFTDQAVFHSGKTVITIPYSKITLSDLGPRSAHPSDVPLYKVWELHKRFLTDKTTYRNLTLNFKDASEGEQSITLEIEETAAANALNSIEIARGRRPAHNAPTDWWGEGFWRTSRTNADWDKRAAELAADDEVRRKLAAEAAAERSGRPEEKPAPKLIDATPGTLSGDAAGNADQK